MLAALIIIHILVLGGNEFQATVRPIGLYGSVTECEKNAQHLQVGLGKDQTAVCALVTKK